MSHDVVVIGGGSGGGSGGMLVIQSEVIDLSMASTAQPEESSLQLTAGTPYVIGIGNWEGSDGSAWNMRMVVIPSAFPL